MHKEGFRCEGKNMRGVVRFILIMGVIKDMLHLYKLIK